MPFNGSGTYSGPSSSWNPAVAATTIDPTAWNSLLTDLSTALSTCLLKDGTQTATSLIPFAAGISADTISEFTSGVGVTADGVLMKDGAVNTTQGADIASASTINLTTATGNVVNVTGTTAITAVTLTQGYWRWVRFTGILTLTNGASLILPTSANITTAAGDYALFVGYASSVVRVAFYQRLDGSALASAGSVNVQNFTSSGTWTKPSGTLTLVRMWGPGGGGASGRKGAAGSARGGGGGGSGGAYVEQFFVTSSLGSTETVTLGAAGAAGAAVSASDTDGNNGTSGGNTTFGSWITAFGGEGGGAGNASGATGGDGAGALSAAVVAFSNNQPGQPGQTSNTAGQFGGGAGASSPNTRLAQPSGWGGAGGGTCDVDATTVRPGGQSFMGGSGGGGGGSISSGNTAGAGSDGGARYSGTAGTGGGGTAGAAGANGNTTAVPMGGGGGGGAGSGGNGGTGAAGTAPGGGGGGGGAAVNAVGNSGAGGAGAASRVEVITW